MSSPLKISTINIGDTFSESRTIGDAEVRAFAQLSGDKNRIHLDDAYAKSTRFGGRIVHGAFLIACLSKVLGMDFPGEGAIFLSQEIHFLKPVHVGDEIRLDLKVTELDLEHRIVSIQCQIVNATKDFVAAQGLSKIKLPKA
jgi:3-hydroxybutyryl-CoA dehydratase